MIFAMPALEASGVMLLMYANGSRNSSAEGRNVGHAGTAVELVRRWSLTLARIARWSSASLKLPSFGMSFDGARVRRRARPADSPGGIDIASGRRRSPEA